MFHIFLAFWCLRTPTFHFWLFSGYIFALLIHYVLYFPCFLVALYPAISFFAFFGVHFRLSHTLCFIFSLLFGGRVPRYFIFWIFSGYIFFLLIHYVSYFPCFLVVAYPAISFLTFFGVRTFSYITYYGFSTLLFALNVPQHFIFNISRGTRLLVHHLLWLQHTPLCPKRTPLFHFLYFSGYAPSRTSLIVASAYSYSPKTYPNILFLTFLWVRYSIA